MSCLSIYHVTDSYVKVVLLEGEKRPRSRKTRWVTSNNHPRYEEWLSFDVAGNKVDKSSLLLSVVCKRKGCCKGVKSSFKRGIVVGRVVVGGCCVCKSSKKQWKSLGGCEQAILPQWYPLLNDQVFNTRYSSISSLLY